MSTLQIEEGRYYLTRSGRTVGPMRKVHEPFAALWPWASDGVTCRDDGSVSASLNTPHPNDLVALAPPAAPPKPPASAGVFTHAAWAALLDEAAQNIRQLSELKGGEYAGDTDRLANFRRNGEALGLPMETVWAVYAGKHWDAIQQYIRDQRSGVSRERLEPIGGRVDDLLVYLLLFKAMLKEAGE